MNQYPLFSILIANYNNSATLLKAVDSVRNQSYQNWEIVIVDDGSSDQSKDIYAALEKDDKISIFRNEKNMGCGYTKAICVEKAKGVICGFLDPDDRLLPEALCKHIAAYQTHSEVGIIYSRCYLEDINGLRIGTSDLLILEQGETYFNHRSLGAMHFCSFKKNMYEKTSGIDKNIKAAVDQDLYFKIEEICQPFVLNEFTYVYVVGGNNAITSTKNKANVYYWNLRVRQDACIRRNLDTDAILLSDFREYFDATYRMAFDAGAAMVHGSFTYKVGSVLLKPIYFIKKFLYGSKG